jgi:hypothetical protein
MTGLPEAMPSPDCGRGLGQGATRVMIIVSGPGAVDGAAERSKLVIMK